MSSYTLNCLCAISCFSDDCLLYIFFLTYLIYLMRYKIYYSLTEIELI